MIDRKGIYVQQDPGNAIHEICSLLEPNPDDAIYPTVGETDPRLNPSTILDAKYVTSCSPSSRNSLNIKAVELVRSIRTLEAQAGCLHCR